MFTQIYTKSPEIFPPNFCTDTVYLFCFGYGVFLTSGLDLFLFSVLRWWDVVGFLGVFSLLCLFGYR